jgi:4-hydroxy-tetrahydrodipicolinate synthase
MAPTAKAGGRGGVYAAVLTPFTDTFEPNLKAFVAHGHWLLANGCDGLAPLGTTGEANSLSVVQRLSLIEAAASGGLPMARCIFGTGSCALADAVLLTKAAVGAGGGGALLLPPFYYKSPSEDGLFAFFSEVIQRVGDNRLRLYLYHFPQLSTVPIGTGLIARLMKEYGATLAGLKDSGGDWNYSAELLKEFPGFGVFAGTEQYLLANLRAGGVGTISASTNVTAPLAQPVFARWREAEADRLQAELTSIRLLFQNYPLQAVLKEMVAMRTGDPNWRILTPPNRSLSEAQRADLLAQLKALPAVQSILAQSRAA